MGGIESTRGGPRRVRFTEERCLWVLAAGQARALRLGLSKEDAEDAALGCLLHLLHLEQTGTLDQVNLTDRWLFRCVDNWLRNSARMVRRRELHETRYPEAIEEMDLRYAASADTAHSPDRAMLANELVRRLLAVLARLTPVHRMRFEELCMSENGSGASPAATPNRNKRRQARWALRMRLRTLMDEAGLTHEEIRDYLSLLG